MVRSACARCPPSPPACAPPQQQAAKQALQSKQHKQHSNHRNTSNREWAQTVKGGKGEGSRLHCSRNLPPPVSARLCTTAARCPKHLNPPPQTAAGAYGTTGHVAPWDARRTSYQPRHRSSRHRRSVSASASGWGAPTETPRERAQTVKGGVLWMRSSARLCTTAVRRPNPRTETPQITSGHRR